MRDLILFGIECRGVRDFIKEVEIEYNGERDLIKKCLLVAFGSEEECLEYWEGYCGYKSMEEIISSVIEMNRVDESGEYEMYEEGWFKIIK